MNDQPSELPGSTTAQTMAHWLAPLLKKWLPHLVAAQLILLLFTKIAGIVAVVCWLCELMPVVWGLAGLLIVLVISSGSLFFAIVLSLAMLEILRSDSAGQGTSS